MDLAEPPIRLFRDEVAGLERSSPLSTAMRVIARALGITGPTQYAKLKNSQV